MSKYTTTDNEGNNTGHCAYCRGVIVKTFSIDKNKQKGICILRCPHCQSDVCVEMDFSGELRIFKYPKEE